MCVSLSSVLRSSLYPIFLQSVPNDHPGLQSGRDLTLEPTSNQPALTKVDQLIGTGNVVASHPQGQPPNVSADSSNPTSKAAPDVLSRIDAMLHSAQSQRVELLSASIQQLPLQ